LYSAVLPIIEGNFVMQWHDVTSSALKAPLNPNQPTPSVEWYCLFIYLMGDFIHGTSISQHLQLTTGGFCWCKALKANGCPYTHPFNGPFSGTTRVSRYQKGKTNLDFTETRDSEWQWHQLGNMQVCTLLQTDNHASTPPLSFLQAGCQAFLPPVQQCRSSESRTPAPAEIWPYFHICPL